LYRVSPAAHVIIHARTRGTKELLGEHMCADFQIFQKRILETDHEYLLQLESSIIDKTFSKVLSLLNCHLKFQKEYTHFFNRQYFQNRDNSGMKLQTVAKKKQKSYSVVTWSTAPLQAYHTCWQIN
jgi:hypothetical protein